MAMAKLSNLLKWSKEIELKGVDGNPIIDPDTKKPVKVWMRVLGDSDLQETYRQGRIKSSKRRTALRNPETAEYQDEVTVVDIAERQDLITLILTARQNVISTEAQVNVERPELPEIEEYSIEPDGPTLEEQEKLDAAIEELEAEYETKIKEYTEQRMEALKAELDAMDIEALRVEARLEISNIGALSEFLNEIADQKIWRGTFSDKGFTTRAFDNVEDFRQTAPVIKDQLREAYSNLELNPEELKK